MEFELERTSIEGLVKIRPHISVDERGSYKKYFEEQFFLDNGLPSKFTEASDILSKKGTLRGLHFQTECSQGKLIHVISGKIFDVALDLRKDSKTFGMWESFYIDADVPLLIYIPEGFAHGFLALEENTVFAYQSTGKYLPESTGGIAWDDKSLGIPWPLNLVDRLIISEKDRNQKSFIEYLEGESMNGWIR